MGGGCCVGDFSCCVMDNIVGNFVKDIFCSDTGCGYHPGPSKTEEHAKKIADELAQMKENIRKSTEKTENDLIDYINRNMNTLIEELKIINRKNFGGKSLNINIEGIKQKNNDLKNQVVGHIADIMDERLVLTDKELSVILEEYDDKKRAKNFDKFCKRIRKEALESLKTKIQTTIKEQSNMVRKEISIRINEVEKSMDEALHEYTDLLEAKNKKDVNIEEKQIKYIYKCELCDLILDEIES